MKNSILIAVSGLILSTIVPTPVLAQSSTISGTVQISKNRDTLICNATAVLDGQTPETSTQVTEFTVTGGAFGLCVVYSFPNTPHDITQGGGEFTVNDFFIDTLWGSGGCEGDLMGTVSGGVVVIDAALPEVGLGSGDCIVTGSLS